MTLRRTERRLRGARIDSVEPTTIAPPFLTRGEIYLRFFLMLGVSAAYALVWLLVVKKKEAWRPVEPSILIAEEKL